MQDRRPVSRLVLTLRLVATVALVAYPFLVWMGLSRLADGASPRLIALVLLAAVAPTAFMRLRRNGHVTVRGLAAIPLITVAALSAAAMLDAAGWMLAVPVAVNAVLLLAFGFTLIGGATPMIERFARLQKPALGAAEQAWCRMWTVIWCAFFAANGGLASALALLAPLEWWALYNGLVAYALLGALLLGEWILRRRRFPRARDEEGTA